jgi:hypothetical protein
VHRLDVFTTGAMLPRPRVGDLVAVLDAGAYGFTESMPLFLSHPTAAEVAVHNGSSPAHPAARDAVPNCSIVRSIRTGSRR